MQASLEQVVVVAAQSGPSFGVAAIGGLVAGAMLTAIGLWQRWTVQHLLADGKRTTARINLNNKDVLNSPYFYLQQNDIVYVEPENKTKVAQTDPKNYYLGIWAAVISSIAFIGITVIDNIYDNNRD